MKILYDHQVFEMQSFGGISRYFIELLKAFNQSNVSWECSVLHSNNEYLKEIPVFQNNVSPFTERENPANTFLGRRNFRGKGTLYKLKNKIVPEKLRLDNRAFNKNNSISKIKSKDYDIFHPTYYDAYFLDYIEEKPFVITVYDMIHQIFPEYFPNPGVDKTKKLLEKATKIIAISHSTKSDIVNIMGIPEEKISVVHLGNSNIAGPSSGEDKFLSKLPEKYFLFVGQRDIYKNFMFFLYLFAKIAEDYKDIHLVCTGAVFTFKETELLKKLSISDRVIQLFAPNTELHLLYKHAIAFVFPSLYEGFGLPVLEAFSAGCPVVLSNTSSLKEIGEDAVIYFEPKNPASFLQALEKVIHNHQLRKTLIVKGYERLKIFSWEKTANETQKIYESVLTH